jgi:hypothetical protein
MRDVTNDTPVARALTLIAPPADQRQRCRELFSQFVEGVASAAPPPVSPVRTREQLVKAATALEKAAAAVKKLPHSRQRQLLPLRLQGLISDPVSQDLRLGIFLNELELAASSASLP